MQFISILNASPTGLNTGRYLRLISLAIADVCLVIFGSLFTMTHDLKISGGLRPYLSWHDAHQNFGQITQITEDWFTSASTSDMSVLGGLFPVYSFTFFILFGFGEEAIREYLRLGKLLANNWMSFRFKR
jgi:pheromone a factor receptor